MSSKSDHLISGSLSSSSHAFFALWLDHQTQAGGSDLSTFTLPQRCTGCSLAIGCIGCRAMRMMPRLASPLSVHCAFVVRSWPARCSAAMTRPATLFPITSAWLQSPRRSLVERWSFVLCPFFLFFFKALRVLDCTSNFAPSLRLAVIQHHHTTIASLFQRALFQRALFRPIVDTAA